MSTFEFDPDTFDELMRTDVPAYPRLQAAVAAASEGVPAGVARLLDLGIGTGTTTLAVLDRHAGAAVVGTDKNERMLGVAAQRLAGRPVEFHVADLVDPLPAGPFDLVVSVLAVHHLEGTEKADLFARVAAALRPGGRFVLGDVVIPLDPGDAVTRGTEGHDKPSTVADQLDWLSAAGLDAAQVWSEQDLVVLRAGPPGVTSPP